MKLQHVQSPGIVRDLLLIDKLAAIGNPLLIDCIAYALFCSVKCPASIILKTYDLAQELKDKGVPVISGFHSPVEKEVLSTLLKGKQPVIICPARSIENMRIPADYQPHLERGRLLLVSPFHEKATRPTQQTALARNRFVAALAAEVFVAYAEPGGKTEQFCREVIGWDKRLYTFESDATRNLTAIGAQHF